MHLACKLATIKIAQDTTALPIRLPNGQRVYEAPAPVVAKPKTAMPATPPSSSFTTPAKEKTEYIEESTSDSDVEEEPKSWFESVGAHDLSIRF